MICRDIWHEILLYLHPIEQIRARLISKLFASLIDPADVYNTWQPAIDIKQLFKLSRGTYYGFINKYMDSHVIITRLFDGSVKYYDEYMNAKINTRDYDEITFYYTVMVDKLTPSIFFFNGINYVGNRHNLYLPLKILSFGDPTRIDQAINTIYNQLPYYLVEQLYKQNKLNNYLLYHAYFAYQNIIKIDYTD